MKDDIITGISDFYETNILARIMQMWEHPIDLVLFFNRYSNSYIFSI